MLTLNFDVDHRQLPHLLHLTHFPIRLQLMPLLSRSLLVSTWYGAFHSPSSNSSLSSNGSSHEHDWKMSESYGSDASHAWHLLPVRVFPCFFLAAKYLHESQISCISYPHQSHTINPGLNFIIIRVVLSPPIQFLDLGIRWTVFTICNAFISAAQWIPAPTAST